VVTPVSVSIIVPAESGSVNVLSVLLLGEAMVKTPVPDALP
jgi:hypothetical protein